MEFHYVKVQNFGSYATGKLDLHDRGLLLLEGPNGHGKSTWLNAICWVLYGRTASGFKGDDVVRQGQRNCFVELRLRINNQPVDIVRFRKHKEHGNKLLLTINHQQADQATTKATEAKIEELIGLDWPTFHSVILFPQGSVGIAALSKTQQKGILEQILKLDRFQKAHQRVSDWIKADQGQEQTLRSQIQALDHTLEELQRNSDTLRQKSEDFETTKEDRQAKAKEKLQALTQATPPDPDQARLQREDLAQRLSEARYEDALHTYDQLRTRERQAQQRAMELHTAMTSYTNSMIQVLEPEDRLQGHEDCPACGQLLPQEARDTLLETFREQANQERAANRHRADQIQAADNELDQVHKEIEAAQLGIEECKAVVEAAEELQRELQALDQQIQNMERDKALFAQSLLTAQNAIKALETEENPFESLIEQNTKRINKIRGQLVKKSSALEPLAQSLDRLRYWHTAFGSQGIKNLLFSTVTPYLNERANVYMKHLSSGKGLIEIKTQRELKSGKLSDDLSFKVIYPGTRDDYSSKSGGERRRADIAIQFAMADLAAARSQSPVPILILDEIFDNLDAEGSELVVDLLINYVVPSRKTVLVMSHNDNLKALFDQRIEVRKHNGISKIGEVL